MESHHDLWRGRRVLVTGCTGFLGAAVTRELLARGSVVAGLVRERRKAAGFAHEISAGRFHVVHGRAEDAIHLHAAMALHEVSAVFHLATADRCGNDRGTAAVLRATALYHSKIPVIVARPAGGLRLAGQEHASPVPLGIARFGEVFGPGDRRESRVVPRTIAALLRGDAPRAEEGPSRDFVFVRDAARACISLAETVGREAASLDLTFRSGWQHTDRELIERVQAAHADDRLAEGEPEQHPNPLGWYPFVTLGDALLQTIAWNRATPQPASRHLNPQRKAA